MAGDHVFDLYTRPAAECIASGTRSAAGSALSEQRCLLPDALSLAASGFRVFPCSAKRPHIRGWPARASTNPEAIRAWWAKWPLANIGLGLRPNELVLDEDGPNAADQMIDLQRQLGPLSFDLAIARSGSGGVHRYFRLPDGIFIKNSQKLLAANIDIKTRGGQVIAPPSLHKSGDRYRWVYRPESINDLPMLPSRWIDCILEKAKRPEKTSLPLAGHESALVFEMATEAKEPAFPWAEEPKGADAVTDEALRAFVSQGCYRYPILGEGQRNHQQARLLAYFLGVKRLPPYQVRRIGHAWLTIFADKIGTPLEQAKQELDRHLERTLRNPGFNNIEADPQFWCKQLSAYRLPPALPSHTPDKRVSCFQGDEGMFVEFLICHARLERARGCRDKFPLTNQQVKDGIKELFGKSWATKTVMKLKDKFISTTASKTKSGKASPSKKATKEELLVRELIGFTGRPSEYRITGLAELSEAGLNRR